MPRRVRRIVLKSGIVHEIDESRFVGSYGVDGEFPDERTYWIQNRDGWRVVFPFDAIDHTEAEERE